MPLYPTLDRNVAKLIADLMAIIALLKPYHDRNVAKL